MKKILYLSLFAFLISFNGYSQCNIIYVTSGASANGAGTIASPKSIEAAFAAATDGTIIRLTAGEYYIDKTLEIPANNVVIDGGFSSDFSRKNETIPYYPPETVINRRAGSPLNDAPGIINYFFIKNFIAIRGEDKSGFEIRDITIHTEDIIYDNYLNSIYKTSNNSVTNYGIYLFRCSNYKIVNTSIKVGSGGNGKEEPFGADGENGKNGLKGGGGSCDDELAPGIGGIGGSAVYTFLKNYGGYGGTGGYEVSGQYNGKVGGDGATGEGPLDGDGGKGATVVGLWGTYPEYKYYTDLHGNFGPVMEGSKGEDGKIGLDGADGTLNTTMNTTTTIYYFPSKGYDGQTGGDGGGGGGGSGGGMQNSDIVNNGAGNGGGGGGSGGTGGSGGNGATGGGGSFGIYTYANGTGSQIINCMIEVSEPAKAGLPGEGGEGGYGGYGGSGGYTCTDQVGAGGDGGVGGHGGKGGKGGPALDGISEKIINNGAAIETIDNYTPTPMTITCAEDVIVACDVDFVLEQPQVSEPCFTGSITNDAPAIFPLGTTIVTWSVVDYYGNLLTCDQNVTILDSVSPDIQCNSIDVYLDNEGRYLLTDTDLIALSAGTTDNCTGSSEIKIYARPVAFYCDDVGEVKVDLVAQDKAGNRSYCRTIVNVIDTSSLKMIEIEDVLIELDSGVCETQIAYPEIVLSNACASVSHVAGLGVDGIFPVGTTIESWKATNTSGDEITVSFNVIVTSVNAVPTIDSIADLEADKNSPIVNVSITGISYGTDCIAQDISLSALAQNADLIAGIVVNYSSPDSIGSLDISLVPDAFGTDTITVTVKDSEGAMIAERFVITINQVNKLPTINAIANLVVEEDNPVITIPISGISYENDLKSQTVIITATGTNQDLVSNITVNYTAPDSTGSIDLTVEPNKSGEETITVTVSDGLGGSVTELFGLKVTPVNDAPYLVLPLPDGSVNASHPYQLALTALMGVVFDDIDDEILSFDVKLEETDGLPVWAVIESNILTATPMIADTGTYSFVVTATDAEGAMATDNFTLVVEGYTTAIGDFDQGNLEVTMYPNPSKGEVNLKINTSEIKDAEVVVRSITGSEVFRKEYKASEQIKIDFSDQVSGVYLITLQHGDHSVIKKLILDRK